jgi:hypothetical protein
MKLGRRAVETVRPQHDASSNTWTPTGIEFRRCLRALIGGVLATNRKSRYRWCRKNLVF